MQLKLDSGVNVALCFNSIQDGIQAKTAQTKSHIKAIHMEVKHNISPNRRSALNRFMHQQHKHFH